MQSMVDQWEKAISWAITFLIGLVMYLVGWIFSRELKSIDERFLQMMKIFNDRMSYQDREIENVNHSLSRLHERTADNTDIERVHPRGQREDRRAIESREDQERSSDEF